MKNDSLSRRSIDFLERDDENHARSAQGCPLEFKEMTMRKISVALLLMALSLISASSVSAQIYPPEMDRFTFMIGEWKGAGWVEVGQGMPQTFTMKQSVSYKAGGGMITIEGLGTEGFPGRPERFVIHQVFLVIGFDWKEKVFRLRSFLYLEGLVDAVPTLVQNVFVWGYQEGFMRRHIRYTIKINEKKQWFEIGEMSSDNGKTWRKFFEMTLDRVR